MGRKYKNPPLVEVVCEFKFSKDTKWDLAIPGLVYEKVKEDFPLRERKVFKELQISQDSTQELQPKFLIQERVYFLTENRNIFIQIGPDILAVNCLKPYPNWENIKPKIEKAFNAFCETTEVKGFQRIGLRFINIIEINEKDLNLKKYFDFYPSRGSHLPEKISVFMLGCIFPFNNGRDLCNVQFANIGSGQSSPFSFRLDFDYFLDKPGEINLSKTLDWIDNAHNEIEKIYEGCIKDPLRELFKEIK